MGILEGNAPVVEVLNYLLDLSYGFMGKRTEVEKAIDEKVVVAINGRSEVGIEPTDDSFGILLGINLYHSEQDVSNEVVDVVEILHQVTPVVNMSSFVTEMV